MHVKEDIDCASVAKKHFPAFVVVEADMEGAVALHANRDMWITDVALATGCAILDVGARDDVFVMVTVTVDLAHIEGVESVHDITDQLASIVAGIIEPRNIMVSVITRRIRSRSSSV